MIHFIHIISCIPQKPVAPSNWLCTLKMIGNTCKEDATIQTQLIDNISNKRAACVFKINRQLSHPSAIYLIATNT